MSLSSIQYVNNYLESYEKYKYNIIKDKCQLILEFINKILDRNYKALLGVKGIKEFHLTKNHKNNLLIFAEYTKRFQEKLDCNLVININDKKFIIGVIKKLLRTIGYVFRRREFGNDYLYTIVSCN